MRQKTLLKISSLLSGVALLLSCYLIWHHYELINGESGFGSFCSINTTLDCDTVNSSKYSEVFGIPLGVFAFAYALLQLTSSLIALSSQFQRRTFIFFSFAFSFFGVLTALSTFLISAFLLHTFCLLCSGMQLIVLFLFITNAFALKEQIGSSSLNEELSKIERKPMFQLTGVAGVVLILVHLISLQLKKEIPFDEEAFIHDFRSQQVQKIELGNSFRQGYTSSQSPPLLLVEFADFQCPSCGMAAKLMHRLVKLYRDKVQLVFKNFPLDPTCNSMVKMQVHPSACYAALASICAQKQGKFIEAYEFFFSNQSKLSKPFIDEWWSKDLKLQQTDLDSCMNSKETKDQLQQDIDQAIVLGVQSTPTFFINGRKVEGALDENRLKAMAQDLGVLL
jgi:protein-disulfide isomerase/uncharacterized membrane protein